MAEAGLPPAKIPRARRRRDDGNARWSCNVLCGIASVRRHASRSARCVPYSWPLVWRCFSQWAHSVAFLIEMLLAGRGLREQANYANEVGEMHELAAEGVGEPTRGKSSRRIDIRRVAVVISSPRRTLRARPRQSNAATRLHTGSRTQVVALRASSQGQMGVDPFSRRPKGQRTRFDGPLGGSSDPRFSALG